jgi:hypothetical protein
MVGRWFYFSEFKKRFINVDFYFNLAFIKMKKGGIYGDRV